jgi:hypothetical protein
LDVIVYVADGEINRPIVVGGCSNGYSSLVAAENNWAEYQAMCLRILCDYVLKASGVSFKSK